MAERRIASIRRHGFLASVCTVVIFGLAPVLGSPPAGAASMTSIPGSPALSASSATTTTTALTLALWEQHYEHDIGIMADDVLVVVDDGKRSQPRVTKAEVKTTVNDCRTWASDAGKARNAAPPIPLADAEQAWTSMIATSALGAADCLAALQHGSRAPPKTSRREFG